MTLPLHEEPAVPTREVDDMLTERTGDLFEQIEGYPKPPLIPFPDLDDLDSLADIGLRVNRVSRRIVGAAMAVTGLTRFYRRLPESFEALRRRVDLRGGHLFPPVLSATLALADDPRSLGPMGRAATLLRAAQELQADIASAGLPPDRHRGQALEMGQYPNLFSTSVIVDGGTSRVFKSRDREHVAVAVGGQLHWLEIGGPGSPSTAGHLADSLAGVVRAAARDPLGAGDPRPGILTCADHETQRRAFRRLQKSALNRESLSALRHSLLTLCLDLEHAPSSPAEAASMAHAGNCANRWYQSSLQLVVFGNGKACAICNFSAYLDGNTMMRGAAELQRRAARISMAHGAASGCLRLAPARRLRWEIPGGLEERARRDLQQVLDNQQATFEIRDFGGRSFRELGASPVAAFLMALERTMSSLVGRSVPIHQMLTMSRYRCMDLAYADVTTPEVERFLQRERGEAVSPGATVSLAEAMESQQRACRRARRYLSHNEIIALYVSSRAGWARALAALALALTVLFLRVLRLLRPKQAGVIVSHPAIHPEVLVVGRPGVRLPYVEHLALHYQIMDERIVVTVTPSPGWRVPNVELVAHLRESLRFVHATLRDASHVPQAPAVAEACS
jgi:hypothetical protein